MAVIDFHIHCYDLPINAPRSFCNFMDGVLGESFTEWSEQHGTAQHYLAVLDDAGVDYAVILAELAPITSAIASNETVSQLCAGSTRLLPFASVNPFTMEHADQELEKLVVEKHFRGLKLYPTYQHYFPNEAKIYPIYAKAQELGIPVMLHTGSSVFPASRMKYGDPLYLDDVAVDFPNLTIVLAHSGRPFWYDRAFTMARFHENVYMEVAGLPPQRLLTYFPELERVADKVIFGSDWPSVATLKPNVQAIRKLPISDESKRKILGGNAARVLKLV